MCVLSGAAPSMWEFREIPYYVTDTSSKKTLTMLITLTIACSPLSFPSFYLAHRLFRKKFLDSIFNQHIALMMMFSGKFSAQDYHTESNCIWEMCRSRRLSSIRPDYHHLEVTCRPSPLFLCPAPSGHLAQLLLLHVGGGYPVQVTRFTLLNVNSNINSSVRFVLVKYSDRGLVNDRYYYNMNLTLFKLLFWTLNLACLLVNQANVWSFSIKHGQSPLLSHHRSTREILKQ